MVTDRVTLGITETQNLTETSNSDVSSAREAQQERSCKFPRELDMFPWYHLGMVGEWARV